MGFKRRMFAANPSRALEFLEFNLKSVRTAGFCLEAELAPSKSNGYIQLSYNGANKFCVLGDMLGWARGVQAGDGEQISHLCGNPKCIIPAHVVVETVVENNRRKNCIVWVDCLHKDCSERLLVCPHNPLCIKYVPGWETWEEFLRWGVHCKEA